MLRKVVEISCDGQRQAGGPLRELEGAGVRAGVPHIGGAGHQRIAPGWCAGCRPRMLPPGQPGVRILQRCAKVDGVVPEIGEQLAGEASEVAVHPRDGQTILVLHLKLPGQQAAADCTKLGVPEEQVVLPLEQVPHCFYLANLRPGAVLHDRAAVDQVQRPAHPENHVTSRAEQSRHKRAPPSQQLATDCGRQRVRLLSQVCDHSAVRIPDGVAVRLLEAKHKGAPLQLARDNKCGVAKHRRKARFGQGHRAGLVRLHRPWAVTRLLLRRRRRRHSLVRVLLLF